MGECIHVDRAAHALTWGAFFRSGAEYIGTPEGSAYVSVGLHTLFLLIASAVTVGLPQRDPDLPMVLTFAQEPDTTDVRSQRYEMVRERVRHVPHLSSEEPDVDSQVVLVDDLPRDVAEMPEGIVMLDASVLPAPAAADPEETVAADDVRNTPVIVAATALAAHNRSPVYPRMARRRGYEGDVLLAINVGSDGNVDDVSVEKSSGFPALDDAARDAALRWRFRPGTIDGAPAACVFRTVVKFALR